MSSPGTRDPLAAAILGAALLVLVGLAAYVVLFVRPPPASRPQQKPQVRQETAKPAALPFLPAAGRTWVYAVTVEPPIWRNITLTYRTEQRGADVGVQTEFKYAGGQMNFYLGTLVPGHPTHANVRFPGFFLHPVYLPASLQPGQHFAWEWAWQPARPGRVKRYEALVQRWEEVAVPAGRFEAALIVADLFYIEGGKVLAKSRETLWYAPKAGQLVKVVREGRTPDEGSERIVAALAEMR